MLAECLNLIFKILVKWNKCHEIYTALIQWEIQMALQLLLGAEGCCGLGLKTTLARGYVH